MSEANKLSAGGAGLATGGAGLPPGGAGLPSVGADSTRPSCCDNGVDRGYIIPIGGAEERNGDSVILRRFLELCGGQRARIIIIPTASRDRDTGRAYRTVFKDLGVADADYLPFDSRSDCHREDWLTQLREADGVFFTGGNQLRLSETLGGTPVFDLLRSRSREGMHVAGTSAGAAFLSQHMIACGDEGPIPAVGMVTLASGLGLTDRFIIDQHFRQRDRLGRLLAALALRTGGAGHPSTIGIGLDEDTAALISPANQLEVIGSGSITVVDPSKMASSGMESAKKSEPMCLINIGMHILTNGARFDFDSRVPTFPSGGADLPTGGADLPTGGAGGLPAN